MLMYDFRELTLLLEVRHIHHPTPKYTQRDRHRERKRERRERVSWTDREKEGETERDRRSCISTFNSLLMDQCTNQINTAS